MIILALLFGLAAFYSGSRLFFHWMNWTSGMDWYDRGSSPSQRIGHWAPVFFVSIFGLYICFVMA